MYRPRGGWRWRPHGEARQDVLFCRRELLPEPGSGEELAEGRAIEDGVLVGEAGEVELAAFDVGREEAGAADDRLVFAAAPDLLQVAGGVSVAASESYEGFYDVTYESPFRRDLRKKTMQSCRSSDCQPLPTPRRVPAPAHTATLVALLTFTMKSCNRGTKFGIFLFSIITALFPGSIGGLYSHLPTLLPIPPSDASVPTTTSSAATAPLRRRTCRVVRRWYSSQPVRRRLGSGRLEEVAARSKSRSSSSESGSAGVGE